MELTIYREIEDMEVELSADLEWTNDSVDSHDYQKDYLHMIGEIDWDRTQYSGEDNAYIESHVKTYEDEIIEEMCNSYPYPDYDDRY